MTRTPCTPLLLTQGDPAGIGPEITVKAWTALRREGAYAFAVVANPDHFRDVVNFEIIEDIPDVYRTFSHALPVLPIDGKPAVPGMPSKDHASLVTNSIETAVALALDGHAAGIVTNPISKDVLYQAGFTFPGHTEFLGALTEHVDMPQAHRGPVMMLSGGGLRVALTTVHVSLKDAAQQLSAESIEKTAHVMNAALKSDFGIENPRIAMTGLNPHAGENGALGREEIEIINPCALSLRNAGINITDAQSADTLFHAEARAGYDAVLAMYHDQGLIPVKTLDFHGGVNITLGLPIVRTSPDHGTAFGIAGQGIARADSLIAAIKTARDIADNRERSRAG